MRKFITQVAALMAWAVLAQAQATLVELRPDAPDKYVVVRGDTLWAIAGRFLDKPWRWPEIWQLNREQIRNPHLIYPGDIVYLDRSGAHPRLRLGKAVGDAGGQAGLATERVSPRVRAEAIPPEPIPTIDAQAIAPFLSRPMVVDEKALESNPRIVATQDGRVNLARGDLAYVRGIADESVRDWHIYRNVRPLLDPVTRKPIAWEALFVGTAKLERAGDPASVRVVAVTEEVGPGDRLLPAEPVRPVNYAPRPPEAKVSGHIVSVHRGVVQAGRNSVVAVSLGSTAGLAPGHVLAISERARVVRDREAKEGQSEQVSLPGQPIGQLLVFRVFDKIAYGLIMRSARDVSVGDVVGNP